MNNKKENPMGEQRCNLCMDSVEWLVLRTIAEKKTLGSDGRLTPRYEFGEIRMQECIADPNGGRKERVVLSNDFTHNPKPIEQCEKRQAFINDENSGQIIDELSSKSRFGY